MPGSFGLIVEGIYDEAALPEYVRALEPATTFIKVFACGGSTRLIQKCPGYLDALQYQFQGGPVEKALVVVDSNGQNPVTLAAQIQSRIAGRRYIFPRGVEVCVAVKELEAWLLGDINAINTIPSSGGAGRTTLPLAQSPETLHDSKGELQRRLRSRGVSYTPEVARRIAAAADLGVLAGRCRSFADFRQKVLDC